MNQNNFDSSKDNQDNLTIHFKLKSLTIDSNWQIKQDSIN